MKHKLNSRMYINNFSKTGIELCPPKLSIMTLILGTMNNGYFNCIYICMLFPL